MGLTRSRWLILLAAAVVLGCGSDRNPVKAAFAQRPPSRVSTPVAFRFPERPGGGVRVYRLPRLDEVTFRFDAPGLAAARVLGYSEEDDQVYLLSPRNTLIGLDLGTGRSRTVDSGVVAATTGPTGTPFVVHADGSLATIEHRVPVAWTAKLPAHPTDVVGAGRGTLLVVTMEPGVKRELLTLSANRPTVSQVIPDGPIATSLWGDVVVIGTDSGLVSVNPAKSERPGFLALEAKPTAVALSPSAHRAYATTGTKLVVLDRFRNNAIAKLDLPGAATAIRPDPSGRILLLRPASGDSTWLVDVATNRYIATIRGSWSADLPAVGPDGTILARQGADLVTLAADSLTPVGDSRGAGIDRWLAVVWDPRRPALQLADQADAAAEQPANEILYVQVSVSQNEAWAQEAAQNLKAAGLNASVLPPVNPDEGFRVVLGPYPTREAAEDAGRRLGRPFWVFSRPQTPATP